MAQLSVHGSGSGGEEDPEAVAAGQIHVTSADDLLDDIDSLLEANAEEFVRSYVQKGGQ